MKSDITILRHVSLAVVLMLAICCFASLTESAQIIQGTDIPSGYMLVDGDMLLPTSFVNVLHKGKETPNAATAVYETDLWPNGVVPFEFDAIGCPTSTSCVTAANRTLMLNAMAVLQNVANVSFQQCPLNACLAIPSHYVHIQNSTLNNSNVGRISGPQIINITSWNSQFVMVHELMHCLGFIHEHQRADRETYIATYNFNVSGTQCGGDTGDCLPQFTINTTAPSFGPYDFDSLMHYGQCAFSMNTSCPIPNQFFNDGGITIGVRVPYTTTWQTGIGQRTHLSTYDKAVLSYLYPQPNWRFLDCGYNGANGLPIGTFRQPYVSLDVVLSNTPPGGTIVVLTNCTFPARIYQNRVTILTAPNVTATFS